jgi:hypothetical protein
MSELAIGFITGAIGGGFIVLVVVCAITINRINEYDAEVFRLRKLVLDLGGRP